MFYNLILGKTTTTQDGKLKKYECHERRERNEMMGQIKRTN